MKIILLPKRNTIVDIIAILFVLLFAYTAFDKIIHANYFENALKKSPLIGTSYAGVVKYAVPVIELIIIGLLLFYKKIGLYAAGILMTLFTIYISYMLIFAPELPCNCGGVISQMSWKQHVVFNSFFILLAITAIILQRKKDINNTVTPNLVTA